MSNPQSEIKGGSLRSPAPKKKLDLRPTPDQMYLASRLNYDGTDWEEMIPGSHVITPAALQKWNMVYGVAAVSDALRMAWGHPPLAGIDNPWAYVDGILRSGS